ncbi:MAG TPA: acyltransferase [Dongiaceae bacterium]|nr:acyltransferase [Dongiaceae bacterium]
MSAVLPVRTSPGFAAAWSPGKNLSALFSRRDDTFDLINGLRSLSFIWILIFHTCYVYGAVAGKEAVFKLAEDAPAWLWWIFNADKAVDLFFVLSGFLIGLILFREVSRTGSIQLGRFYFRRYLRLTPVYALVLGVYWLSGARNHEQVWANLFYVNNFLEAEAMPLQWTWSLAVEEQFYLLLPLILIGIARLPGRPFMRVMGGLLVLSFLIRLVAFLLMPDLWSADYRTLITEKPLCLSYYEHIYDNLITRYGPFVCGTMAACAYCSYRETLGAWLRENNSIRIALNLVAAAMVLVFLQLPVSNQIFAGGSWQFRTYVVVHHTLFAGGIAWLMLDAFLNQSPKNWLIRFLSLRLWQPFSQLTYSMYLVHVLVILGVTFPINRILKNMPELDATVRTVAALGITAVLSLAITALIGILCWLLIEKPFLNLRDQAGAGQGAASAAPLQRSLA